jgi:hypothetical protein
MTLVPKHQVWSLSEWLQIATRELTVASKERIRPEIEAHYAEAIEAHRRSDLSEWEAQKAALAELGDPHAAGKRFRKRHLTEFDMDRIEKSVRGARSIWNLLRAYFVFCVLTFALPFRRNMLEHYHSFPLYLGTAFLVMLALPTACFLVARYNRSRPNGPLLLIYSLSDLAWWPFLFSYFTFAAPPLINHCFFAIVFCVIPIGRLVIFLRLWIKFSKARIPHLGQAS